MKLHDDMKEIEDELQRRFEPAWRALSATGLMLAFVICCLVVAGAFR